MGLIMHGGVAYVGIANISDANDVDLSSPADGQFLKYNGEKWVNASISAVYRPAGSKTVAQLLPALLIADNIGKVYNMTDSGETTEYFVEGQGKIINAGDNVVIVNIGTDQNPNYKFDMLSSNIDMSEYYTADATDVLLAGKVDKVTGKGLSTNDYTNEEKALVATIPDKADADDVAGTQTVSGNPLTLTDCAPINAESLVVELEPKQDLHGYDHPWVGGAWKNKLNYDLWKGRLITRGTAVWENNGVTLTATGSDCYTDFISENARVSVSEGEIVKLSWEESTNKSGYVFIFPNDSATGSVNVNNNTVKEISYTVPSDVTYISFRFGVANTGDTISYKNIMIRKSGDATFAPYSNICPITGYTQTSVETLTDIQSYYDIQTIVRAGKAQEVFSIGDEIPVKYTATNGTQYDMPFRVVAFQNVELQDGTTKQGMFLQSKYATLEGVQFDAPEPDNTLGSGGAKDSNVANYGYNRWSESGIRAWLNSNAAANNWWGSTFERGGQTVTRRAADVAPTQLASVNGFLRGLPSSFVDVLGKVKMQTSCNTVTDSGVTDTTYDKIFLASLEQMYATPQASGVEGEYFEYWKEALGLNSPSSWNPTTYEAYKTYALENHNSAQYVRLRSVSRGDSCGTWHVNLGGGIGSGNAHYALRSAPVCVIC